MFLRNACFPTDISGRQYNPEDHIEIFSSSASKGTCYFYSLEEMVWGLERACHEEQHCVAKNTWH